MSPSMPERLVSGARPRAFVRTTLVMTWLMQDGIKDCAERRPGAAVPADG